MPAHAIHSSVRASVAVRPCVQAAAGQGTKKQQERHGRQSRTDKRTGASDDGLDSHSELRTTFTVHPSMRRRRRRRLSLPRRQRRRRHDSQARRRHFPTASGQKTHTKERERGRQRRSCLTWGSFRERKGHEWTDGTPVGPPFFVNRSGQFNLHKSTAIDPPPSVAPSVGPPRWRR